jgi:membrane protein implicated in regulation of membrane protease activity
MPILPIIDLLILMAWTVLFGAFGLKLIGLTTSYSPTLFGLGPLELTLIAAVLLLFAIALALRTWLRSQESTRSGAQMRAASTLQAYSEVQEQVRRAELEARRSDSESAMERKAGNE